MLISSYNYAMPGTLTLPFGRALWLRRNDANLTQEGLANKLEGRLVDTKQSTVSKWEQRATAPKDRFVLEALADVLNCSIEDLIAGRVPIEMLGALAPRDFDLPFYVDDDQEVSEARHARDPRIEQINAHLLTMRELDDEEITQVEAIIRAMVDDLKRRRRERENAERARENT